MLSTDWKGIAVLGLIVAGAVYYLGNKTKEVVSESATAAYESADTFAGKVYDYTHPNGEPTILGSIFDALIIE